MMLVFAPLDAGFRAPHLASLCVCSRAGALRSMQWQWCPPPRPQPYWCWAPTPRRAGLRPPPARCSICICFSVFRVLGFFPVKSPSGSQIIDSLSVHAQGVRARAQAWAQEVGRSLWQVVRIRTFLVIVLQARPCMPCLKSAGDASIEQGVEVEGQPGDRAYRRVAPKRGWQPCCAGHRGRHALDRHGLHRHIPAAAGLQRLISENKYCMQCRASWSACPGSPWATPPCSCSCWASATGTRN